MALVTVQRSPTPSTTSSPCASVSPLPAAAPLASVTAAPLCLSGSRRAPLRTRRAASQALAPGCREPPTRPHLKDEPQELPDVDVCLRHSEHLAPHHPRPEAPCGMLSSGLSTSFREWVILAFHPPPSFYPLLLCCRERTPGLLPCPLPTPTSPYPHPFQGPVPSSPTARPSGSPGVCLPPGHLLSFLCPVHWASLDGWTVVTPRFLAISPPPEGGGSLCSLDLSPFLDEVLKHLALLDDQCQFIYISQTCMHRTHCSWSFLFSSRVCMARYFRCQCQWSVLPEGKYPVTSLFLLGPSLPSPHPHFFTLHSFRLFFFFLEIFVF